MPAKSPEAIARKRARWKLARKRPAVQAREKAYRQRSEVRAARLAAERRRDAIRKRPGGPRKRPGGPRKRPDLRVYHRLYYRQHCAGRALGLMGAEVGRGGAKSLASMLFRVAISNGFPLDGRPYSKQQWGFYHTAMRNPALVAHYLLGENFGTTYRSA